MTYPAWQIDFAPGVPVGTQPAAGDWVNISSDVRRIATGTGTTDEFAESSTTDTALLVLDSSDGRYDPDFAGGPYYGDLLPLVWFRVRGGTTAANQDAFYGLVSMEGWQIRATQFPDVEVTVELVDAGELFANTDLPPSPYVVEVLADAPVAWYRLGEQSGTTAYDSSGNGNHGTYEGGLTFNTRDGLIENDDDNALAFADEAHVLRAPTSASVTLPFTVETWFVAEPGTGRVVYWQGASNDQLNFQIASTGLFFEHQDVSGGKAAAWLSTASYADGERHHAALAYVTAGTAPTLYVDGVADTMTLTTVPGPAPAMHALPQPVFVGNSSHLSDNRDAVLDEVAVYDYALSTARMVAHHNAGATPWAGDLTSARVSRLLDVAGWPTALRNIDTGQTTMQAASFGQSLDQLIADAVKAEGGSFFIDHRDGGKARFRDRRAKWEDAASNTSQATFGDGPGEIPCARIDVGDDRVVNSATVGRANGETVTVTDDASEATYLRRSYTDTALLYEDDAESRYRAEGIVNAKKDRRRRVRAVVLEPRASTHPAWAHVFARRRGDRVTVKWRPAYGGTETFECHVSGIGHEWSADDGLRTVLSLVPAPAQALVWGGTAAQGWGAGVWTY